MMEITKPFRMSLVKAKGMDTVKKMSISSGVNRWTLSDILNSRKSEVTTQTYCKLEIWLRRKNDEYEK
nr:hypothetical protein [Lactiplantibacillus plantarum]